VGSGAGYAAMASRPAGFQQFHLHQQHQMALANQVNALPHKSTILDADAEGCVRTFVRVSSRYTYIRVWDEENTPAQRLPQQNLSSSCGGCQQAAMLHSGSSGVAPEQFAAWAEQYGAAAAAAMAAQVGEPPLLKPLVAKPPWVLLPQRAEHAAALVTPVRGAHVPFLIRESESEVSFLRCAWKRGVSPSVFDLRSMV
jgi:hypothetical protein